MLRRGKKTLAAVTATAIAAGLLVAGTLAWQAIEQAAVNELEAMQSINEGARLHDDFDGSNKDVYVENFMDPDTGNPVYARIRLDEYMEYGTGVGLQPGEDGFEDKQVTVVNKDADPTPVINNKDTWTTRIPGKTMEETVDSNPFWKYMNWSMGGQTTYMPTFNKDSMSLKPDINGTLEGTVSGDLVHYDDHHAWSLGEEKTADATYSGGETVSETHYGEDTLTAQVMTMAEWKEAGSVPGDYWVWDSDGWAYWANPIRPGQATGLLLNGIEMGEQVYARLYYAIHVVGQFVSQDDTGKGENTGFYMEGEEPSADAEVLLERIGAVTTDDPVQTITVTPDNTGATSLPPGGTLAFGATKEDSPAEVTWMVSGNTQVGTTVGGDGTLTVDDNEPLGSVLTVTAVEKPLPGGETPAAFGSYTVTVSSNVAVLGGMEATNGMVLAPQSTKIQLGLKGYEASGTVTWEVEEKDVSRSTITQEGVLTVGTLITGATEGSLTITATDEDKLCAKVTFTVQGENLSGVDSFDQVVPGSRTKVTVDGADWYVLVNDGAKVLVWASDIMGEQGTDTKVKFSSDMANGAWADSEVRSYLKDTILPTLPSMAAVPTHLTTWNGVGENYIASTDSIFLLSEADIVGSRGGSAAKDSVQDYTYVVDGQGIILVPDNEIRKTSGNATWLRSGYKHTGTFAYVTICSNLGVCNEVMVTSSTGVRPAMWVSLE